MNYKVMSEIARLIDETSFDEVREVVESIFGKNEAPIKKVADYIEPRYRIVNMTSRMLERYKHIYKEYKESVLSINGFVKKWNTEHPEEPITYTPFARYVKQVESGSPMQ